MYKKTVTILLVALVSCMGETVATGRADEVSPLVLAQDGQTKYEIVIGQDAGYGENLAAKELSYYLLQLTGAEFQIKRDN